jgi:AsmA protein
VRLRAGGVAGAALRFEGNAQRTPEPALSGTFNLTAPSLARLAALAGRADALAAIPGRDITDVTLEGRLGGATELNANGRATINGQVLQLTFESGPLSQFGQARIPLQLRVQGAPLTLAFNGQVDRATANRPPPASGTLELTVPSLRALAAWAGRPFADSLAPGQLNALSFQGRVAAEPTRLTITDARFALDQLRGSGTFEAAVGGARPRLAGRLAFDRLDLNPYMAARPAGARGAAPAAPAAPAGNQPAAPPPAAAQAARAGWDDTPIDAGVLRAADLDLNVTLAGLVAPTIELGRTALRMQLNDGQLDTQINEMALYRGQARGSLRVDARQVLGVQSQMELAGVQALPLLRALAGMEKLEGTITATWTLRANGPSQRALVQALDGQARMRVTDGALVGVNLAALVRSVGALGLDGTARDTQRTDFSDLSASFAIQNGVATTQDMAMNSPLLRVQGRGAVNLAQRAVDMVLDTRLVATLQGQGGREARGFTVPVHVSGPFDHLSYRPDLSGISREELRELTRNPGELLRNPGEALRNLIPGGQPPQQPSQPDQQQPQQPQPQQPQQRQLPNLPFRIPGLGR